MNDNAFNILTRNGLEEKLRKKKNFSIVIIDFNNVKKMNKEFGYEKVNNLFSECFNSFNFRKSDLVGRWFSGDEIAIITYSEDINNLIERFREHCKQYNLFFKKILERKNTFNGL